jgi:hypothetical protein
MVNYARIQHKIDKGLGIAARHLGPPYSAYRIDANATGDYPAGWDNVGVSVPVFVRRTTDAKIQSALLASGTVWFDVIGNMEKFLVGDVFQLTDPAFTRGKSYGAGATSVPYDTAGRYSGFALAWHAPVDEPVGARLDVRLRIYRPLGTPDSSLTDGSRTWRSTTYAAQPLVLAAGTYSFADPYSGVDASYVPAGIASTDRPPRGHLFPPASTPGDMQIARYFIYLPNLPGYTPSEGDRLVQEQGQRYLVTNPYYQLTGVAGMQLGVERRIAED